MTDAISIRRAMIDSMIAAAERDPRIVGMLDYGSSSEGRLDEWSDVDVAIFIRDAEYATFLTTWASWARQFGDLLLAYTGHIGHPWTVYDTEPAPLRVDFDLIEESAISSIPEWPNNPSSVEAMLWYDGTGGLLRAQVEAIVGNSLAPVDPEGEFVQLTGDFYYYLLYCHSKLQRGDVWVARQAFHREVLEPLLRLMRMEAGALDRWRGSQAGLQIESVVSPERFAELDACIPGPAPDDLRQALSTTARLGSAVCQNIAEQHDWPWPSELAGRLEDLFRAKELG